MLLLVLEHISSWRRCRSWRRIEFGIWSSETGGDVSLSSGDGETGSGGLVSISSGVGATGGNVNIHGSGSTTISGGNDAGIM